MAWTLKRRLVGVPASPIAAEVYELADANARWRPYSGPTDQEPEVRSRLEQLRSEIARRYHGDPAHQELLGKVIALNSDNNAEPEPTPTTRPPAASDTDPALAEFARHAARLAHARQAREQQQRQARRRQADVDLQALETRVIDELYQVALGEVAAINSYLVALNERQDYYHAASPLELLDQREVAERVVREATRPPLRGGS